MNIWIQYYREQFVLAYLFFFLHQWISALRPDNCLWVLCFCFSKPKRTPGQGVEHSSYCIIQIQDLGRSQSWFSSLQLQYLCLPEKLAYLLEPLLPQETNMLRYFIPCLLLRSKKHSDICSISWYLPTAIFFKMAAASWQQQLTQLTVKVCDFYRANISEWLRTLLIFMCPFLSIWKLKVLVWSTTGQGQLLGFRA